MYRYHVWCDIESGSDGIQFEIKDPPHRWSIEFEDGGTSTAAVHLCQGKNVLVVLDCQREASQPDLLIQSVIQHVQALFDAALFSCGISGTVIGRAALLPNGQIANLKFHDVRRVIDPEAMGLTVEEITRCSIESQIVRTCFSDLRRASLNLQDAGMLCYRTVESVMQTYKQSDSESSKEAWPRMRDALRFEKSYIDTLVSHSISNRHGTPLTITTEEGRNLLTRALTIIGRFARVSVLQKSIAAEVVLK
jgi:hypothetical protein